MGPSLETKRARHVPSLYKAHHFEFFEWRHGYSNREEVHKFEKAFGPAWLQAAAGRRVPSSRRETIRRSSPYDRESEEFKTTTWKTKGAESECTLAAQYSKLYII